MFRGEISNPQHYPISVLDVEQASSRFWHRRGPEREASTNIRYATINPLDLRSEVHQQILLGSTSSEDQLLGYPDGKQLPTKILLLGNCVVLLFEFWTCANDDLQLGAGEAGKTTILKQMRLIYGLDSFSLTDYENIRPSIFSNMLFALSIIFEELPRLGLQYQDKSVEVSAPTIKSLNGTKHLKELPADN